MDELNFILPEPPKPPRGARRPSAPSMRSTAGVFVAAFVILVMLFNAPSLFSSAKYSLTHSESDDNEQLTREYRALYGYREPSRPSAVEVAEAAPVPAPIAGISQTNSISIAKIGINAPIIQIQTTDNKTVLKSLKNGVVLYPGSGNPGGGSTTVIIGHSSSDLPRNQYSSIFALLDRLQPNDLVKISFGGREYTYQVRGSKRGSVQQILDSGLAGDLVLSSCWPVGSDQGRIAVVANLIR
ncbi:MAG: hypothetical protein A3C88_00930 [Candidatus Yanofskybacteria bacterium RIFCSPHIGHO2_02_FULL_50_12]|uniref:Sortase n=1 Tax=Candidatus Yanofskybacteria bacterium RIFCSPHIGHO2_02_FULL_50_12 TaxID=1802685 RepID=A0A1F8FXM6_9BACT|nr:MAG: hypothetical protein A3C88_00930 [Candidatus Yanofskybacteria bacterium RIFCSPHIGHO2_02_FULL_50_12]